MSVYLEDLQPGMSADYGKTITEADILLFSAVSGDNNPVHLNAEYAENTLFKTRIANGMLTASFISTIVGPRLPGEGTIFLSNSCKFKAPVRIGDTVTARCTVSVIDVEKKRVTFKTECWVKDTLVLEGEAVVMPPRRG